MFDYMADDNVTYCVLRNFEGLPHYVGNDIDILLEKKSVADVISKLQICAIRHRWMVHRIESQLSLDSIILAKNGHQLRIDFFSDLTKAWIQYAHSPEILAAREPYEGFFVANDVDVVYTIVVKELLTYGYVRRKYRKLIVSSSIPEHDFVKRGFGLFTDDSLRNVYRQVFRFPKDFSRCNLRATAANFWRPSAAFRWLVARMRGTQIRVFSRQS